jgi:SAM-dependent methyltransferase
MAELGWEVAGIELVPEAAAIAREVTRNIFVGDLMRAPFPDGSFDLVTAFHVVEHLPDPLEALQRILRWVAPGGRAIIEVPNFAGIGRRVFGCDWHGLDLPFHLSHFTPRTLQRFIERAGATVVQIEYCSDPHSMIKSLENLVKGRGGHRAIMPALGLIQNSMVKRLLSLSLRLFNRIGLSEAIRVTIVPVEN